MGLKLKPGRVDLVARSDIWFSIWVYQSKINITSEIDLNDG